MGAWSVSVWQIGSARLKIVPAVFVCALVLAKVQQSSIMYGLADWVFEVMKAFLSVQVTIALVSWLFTLWARRRGKGILG